MMERKENSYQRPHEEPFRPASRTDPYQPRVLLIPLGEDLIHSRGQPLLPVWKPCIREDPVPFL